MNVSFTSGRTRYSLIVSPAPRERGESDVKADPLLWASAKQKRECSNILGLSEANTKDRRERQRHYRKVYQIGEDEV